MHVISAFRTVWPGLCIGASGLTLAGALVCLMTFHYPLLYLLDIFTLPFLTATAGLSVAGPDNGSDHRPIVVDSRPARN